MSLQFVLGNSRSGKSGALYGRILKEAKENPGARYLVIVPEQFTMQIQKELTARSPRHGIMNIDVLSFERLAYRIFEETGGPGEPLLDETGKTLAVQRVIQEKAKELGVLASAMKKQGTVGRMKSLVSELMQYDVGPEQLASLERRASVRPALAGKLADIRLIYQGFLDFLERRFLAPEELLDAACVRVSEASRVRGAVLVLDEFTGFTPVQHKLLRELLKYARKIYVTVTADRRLPPEKMRSPQNLFHMSGVMMERLIALARDERVEIEEPLWIAGGGGDAASLAFLERHLFRYHRETFAGAQEEIQIFAARDPQEEMEEIARRIRYLVRTRGYCFGDFAVITGDPAAYGAYARQVFEDAGIPYFIDEKHSILRNPFVEYILAALQMLTESFSYESVFRYLRCGLSGLRTEEVDRLETYCIGVGIRGFAQWNAYWTRRYRGMEEAAIGELNDLRARFVAETEEFRADMAGRRLTVRDRTKALYLFIRRGGLQEKIKKMEERFAAGGDRAKEKEYAQIYRAIIDLLDKMVEILGDEEITAAEYQKLLEAGLEETKVGVVPPNADQVLVGDMERTRLKNVRVLFFAGVSDQVIPKRNDAGGLLSETDREYFREQKVELAPDARETMYIQKYYLYLNLTRPSDRLILSYARTNGQGQAQSPAYLFQTLYGLFPYLAAEDVSLAPYEAEQPEAAVPGLLEGFLKARREEPSDQWKELLGWFLRAPGWKSLCARWIGQIYHSAPPDRISKDVARALYGKTLTNSTTQLERFAACAFAHFLQYGLKIQERQEYEFRAVDLGNVIHEALERFAKNLGRENRSWRGLDGETRERLIDQSVDEMIYDYGNTILASSERNRYMILRVKRILRRTVWALQKQLEPGKYEPEKFEVSFAMAEDLDAVRFWLSREESIRLRGRIDRVDRYEEGDTIYLKVIDYKSGNTSMGLVALYYGLQLQLVVYLNAALELEQKSHPGKKIEPAGIFYYQVKDPMTEGGLDLSEAELEQRLLEALKVNGLVRAEEKIIRDMDGTLGPGKKSAVIPVAYNKNGSLSRFSHTANAAQFQALSDYVNRKILELGRKILGGNVERRPYLLKKRTACDYCAYRQVCGFDEKEDARGYRRLKEFPEDEAWKLLEGEGGERDG